MTRIGPGFAPHAQKVTIALATANSGSAKGATMNSDEPTPEIPNQPSEAFTPDSSEDVGSNGTAAGRGARSFDGPIARKPTPEELEWALQQFSREDIVAGLREIEMTCGVSSEEFLRAVGQAARDDG